MGFQFFPSCCVDAKVLKADAVKPFNSFPVAAVRLNLPLVRKYAAFNSFPVAARAPARGGAEPAPQLSILSQLLQRRGSGAPPPRPAPIFQFFPSCCRGSSRRGLGRAGAALSILSQLLLLKEALMDARAIKAFNSFPVAARSHVALDMPPLQAFNSFPVAAWVRSRGRLRSSSASSSLSILSQLLQLLDAGAGEGGGYSFNSFPVAAKN